MTHAVRPGLRDLEQPTSEDPESLLTLRRAPADHPQLGAHSLVCARETERRLAEAIAARSGRDPDAGPLPHLVVAFAMAPMRVDIGCAPIRPALQVMVRRIEETLQFVE